MEGLVATWTGGIRRCWSSAATSRSAPRAGSTAGGGVPRAPADAATGRAGQPRHPDVRRDPAVLLPAEPLSPATSPTTCARLSGRRAVRAGAQLGPVVHAQERVDLAGAVARPEAAIVRGAADVGEGGGDASPVRAAAARAAGGRDPATASSTSTSWKRAASTCCWPGTFTWRITTTCARTTSVAKRSILSIQAGTATSTRRRGEPNAYNWITVSPDLCTVAVRAWNAGRSFEESLVTRYQRVNHGWTRRSRCRWTSRPRKTGLGAHAGEPIQSAEK